LRIFCNFCHLSGPASDEWLTTDYFGVMEVVTLVRWSGQLESAKIGS